MYLYEQTASFIVFYADRVVAYMHFDSVNQDLYGQGLLSFIASFIKIVKNIGFTPVYTCTCYPV